MTSIISSIISSYTYLHPDAVKRATTYISNILGACSTCTPPNRPPSPLDSLGVASLFGGDEAVSAISTVHIYGNSRWWLGWYNSPGSYQIAKRLALLGRSRFLDDPSPGVHIDPAKLDKLDCSMGPKFRASHSGTIIEQTSHVASLFMAECAAREGKIVEGRTTETVGVTIAKLNHSPECRLYPTRINAHSPVLSTIPILVSVSSCVACAAFRDWYSFTLILSGIFAHGVSRLVVGSGKFAFTHPRPPRKCPPGGGILGTSKEIVLLMGEEGAVNSITRGKFSLEFSSDDQFQRLGWCSFLLKVHSIAQLFLVPQSSLLGQVVFAASLSVSWIYNSWLSLDKNKVQQDILLDSVFRKPELTKFIFGTRTAAVVFILLVLQPADPRKILDELIPNDTSVWNQLKKRIVGLVEREGPEPVSRDPEVKARGDDERLSFKTVDDDSDLDGFSDGDKSLFKTLCDDVRAACNAHILHKGSSSHSSA